MGFGFGSQFVSNMMTCHYREGQWTSPEVRPFEALQLSPALHALHYASSCFEGLKAHRNSADGIIRIFRLDTHMRRMQRSAELMLLPVPPLAMLTNMVTTLVDACRDEAPYMPSALYLRPVLLGTQPNVGAATTPSEGAMLYVIASPVDEYFSASAEGLRVLMDDTNQRSTQTMGAAKTGGNYASALPHMVRARKEHKAHQVLFAPGGDVQETGAANFLLLREGHILTRELDGTILHGVTRDSLLQIAGNSGFEVSERRLSIEEVLTWVKTGEAALSGTAAGLAPIGELLFNGHTHHVADANISHMLLSKLHAIHAGEAEDEHGWVTIV